MSIKVGDKVSFLDEPMSGEVLYLSGNSATVLREDGFEEEVPVHSLIIKRDMKINETREKDLYLTNPALSQKKTTDYLEVDLHIHHWVEFSNRLSNFEMLIIQLNEAKKAISKARKAGIKRVVLIHGIGEGKLKAELEEMLDGMERLSYFDANYQKYGKGATEVELY